MRQLPLIKHLFTVKFYSDGNLKRVIRIFINLYRVVKAFAGKLLYLGLMITLPMFLTGSDGEMFVHVLFVLTIAGAVGNTEIFNASKEKYYAIILMRMEAKGYIIANYVWFLLKSAVTFLPAMLLFGWFWDRPAYQVLLMVLYIVAAKILGAFLLMRHYEKTGRLITEGSGKVVFSAIAICLLSAYVPMIFHQILPLGIYMAGMAAVIILAVYPLVYLMRCQTYKRMCKEMLNQNEIIFDAKEKTRELQRTGSLQNIDEGEVKTGNKRGYEYFNAIFVERHRKILTRSIKWETCGIMILTAILCIGSLFFKEAAAKVNLEMLNMLPYVVFIMYILNRSNTMTQAMFMNCDHSMLAYRFYRQKEVILGLFKIRLRTLVKLNLIPASALSGGLVLLLLLTGGTENPFNYLLIIVSILAMSVFFTVHHLILYYLLQPFDINMEARSSAYAIANGMTYGICYIFIQFEAPLVVFSLMTIVFSVIYICVALRMVYQYAPKRFRLK